MSGVLKSDWHFDAAIGTCVRPMAEMPASGYNPIIQVRCTMLAEKFFLVLEALRSANQYLDGSPRVKCKSPHVPIELPTKK